MDVSPVTSSDERSDFGVALRDSAVYFFAQLGARGLSFAFYFVLARSLPVDEFGYLNFALVLIVMIDIVIDLGLSRFASREVAKNHAETFWILRLFMPYKLAAAFAAFGLVWIGLDWGQVEQPGKSIVLYFAFGLFLTAPSMLVENVLQAHHKFRLISLAHIALSVSQAGLGVLVLWLSAKTSSIALVFVAANAAYLSVLLFGLSKIRTSKVRLASKRTFAACVPGALPFMLGAVIMLLSTRIEFFVLSWYGSAADLGVYGVVAKLVEVALLVPMALGSVMLPRFAVAHEGQGDSLTRVYAAGLQFLLCASIPVAALVWTFAFLLPLALNSPEFGISGSLASFQFLGYPFACVFVFNTFLLLGAPRQRTALVAWCLLAALQFLINVILQRNFGIYGTVSASVVCSIIGAISTTALICAKYVNVNAVFAAVLPCLVAAALIAFSMALITGINPFLALGVALVAYLAVIWSTGIAKNWMPSRFLGK